MATLELILAGNPLTLRGPNDPLERASDFFRSFKPKNPSFTDPPHTLRVSRQDGKIRVSDGDERVIGARSADDYLLLLLNYLTQLYLDFLPASTLAIHSSGLRRNGAVLMTAGECDSGKSTTLTRLLRPTDTYLSDELIGIDPDTRTVYPFPRPIKLDPGAIAPDQFSARRLENTDGERFQFLHPPETTIKNEPLDVKHLSVVELQRGNHAPQLETVPPGRQFQTLENQALRPVESTRRFHTISEFIRLADPFRTLKYTEIDTVADRLHELLEPES